MRTRFNAARVLPDSRSDFTPGAVVIEDHRIVWVGPQDQAPEADTTVDLNEATLTPGLVNAHCHLDLSHLKGKVPYEGEFASWLKAVAEGRERPGMADAATWCIKDAIACGTTSFGDVVSPRSFETVVGVLADTKVRARIFVEAIGFKPEVAHRVFDRVWELVEMRELPPRVETGISPHALYSVSKPLLTRIAAVADGHNRPLAVHTAETMEELAFLRHGIGPLRELLKSFDADDPEHEPYKALPEFLKLVAVHRAPLLLVHCNYLRPRDVPAGAFAVYCPTAHHFFGHPEHPVVELLEEGVRVALGSDSAASGDTVDLLSETKFLSRARLDLPPRTIFQMATEWGANALGLEAGKLEAGRHADLAAFKPAAGHEVLGMVDTRCVMTAVGGEILHCEIGEADTA
ncbi:MAG: amidohydrolase family protein [Planctomycetota bacterium]|jgi:cytosine/adenosine deaminase-related metal-dependent hydrolase